MDTDPVDATRKRAAARPRAERPRPLRVLIVEDHRDTAEMMDGLLRGWNHETRIVHNGVQAVELAEQWHPDVVLLDVVMPKMHGHDVARALRERPWAKDLRLIAVTAWGQEADRQLSRGAGIHHHLVKPVDPRKLRKLLDQVEVAADG